MSCSGDRDIICKESNNYIIVECQGKIINIEQEKQVQGQNLEVELEWNSDWN